MPVNMTKTDANRHMPSVVAQPDSMLLQRCSGASLDDNVTTLSVMPCMCVAVISAPPIVFDI